MMRTQTLWISLLALVACSSCATLPPALRGLDPTTRQAVVVTSRGANFFEASLSAWERAGRGWRRILGPWPAVVGRSGFALRGEKREGDGRTPSGIFAIGTAFGRDAARPTGLSYRQATPEDFWVDDVSSAQYNQWVRGRPLASSFETMLREDGLYDLGTVIEYNTNPVVPGLGSAIFVHIWRDGGKKPTAGCVALSRPRLAKLLSWLDAEKIPVVVLGRSGKTVLTSKGLWIK